MERPTTSRLTHAAASGASNEQEEDAQEPDI